VHLNAKAASANQGEQYMAANAETDPIGRQLDTYEESWKSEHEAVKQDLWVFEDTLAVGLALYKVIHGRYWSWRARVHSGKIPYCASVDDDFKTRFAQWLQPCSGVMSRLLELEGRYKEVEGAHQFRSCYHEALQTLRQWSRPELLPQPDPANSPNVVQRASDHPMGHSQLAAEVNKVAPPLSVPSIPLRHKVDHTKVF
jgi:hypothetical protein